MKKRIGPDGVHFFDRANGNNILINELLLPEADWTVAPRQISVALTNICDLHCKFCYAPKIKASLPFDYLKKWLKEIDQLGTFGVGFGGGEPTLYPKFAEICEFTANETDLAVTFTTHGHRLTDDLLSNLKGNVNFIRISIDGVGTTYEKFRGRKFDKLIESFDTEDLPVKMAGVVDDFNPEDFGIDKKELKKLATKKVFNSKAIIKMEIAANNILSFFLENFMNAFLYYDTDLSEEKMTGIDQKFIDIISDNYLHIYKHYSKQYENN